MLINYDLQHVDLSKTFEIHKFTVKKSLDNNLETQRERESACWFVVLLQHIILIMAYALLQMERKDICNVSRLIEIIVYVYCDGQSGFPLF